MAGRGLKGFLSQAADALFIPGNAYNSNTGRWNPATTKSGIAGLIADQFIPGGSNLVGMAGRGGLFGSGFAQDLRNEGIYNTLADQYGQFRGDLADQYLHPSVDIGNNPQVDVGRPQTVSTGGYAPMTPTMPQVDVQGPWQGLGSNTGNVFNGGSLGRWATGGGQSARPMGGNLSFGGGMSGYNNGAGAGTGFGASSYQNDAWGDTASGFGIGATSAGSSGSWALADAMAANKKNRD